MPCPLPGGAESPGPSTRATLKPVAGGRGSGDSPLAGAAEPGHRPAAAPPRLWERPASSRGARTHLPPSPPARPRRPRCYPPRPPSSTGAPAGPAPSTELSRELLPRGEGAAVLASSALLSGAGGGHVTQEAGRGLHVGCGQRRPGRGCHGDGAACRRAQLEPAEGDGVRWPQQGAETQPGRQAPAHGTQARVPNPSRRPGPGPPAPRSWALLGWNRAGRESRRPGPMTPTPRAGILRRSQVARRPPNHPPGFKTECKGPDALQGGLYVGPEPLGRIHFSLQAGGTEDYLDRAGSHWQPCLQELEL